MRRYQWLVEESVAVAWQLLMWVESVHTRNKTVTHWSHTTLSAVHSQYGGTWAGQPVLTWSKMVDSEASAHSHLTKATGHPLETAKGGTCQDTEVTE